MTVAVGAFRVAVELDLKRRDNDKKISLLFVEMRDMMAVLIQYVNEIIDARPQKLTRRTLRLRDINGEKRAGEDHTTIAGRMQNLIEKTEQDIKKCANACNAYAKKNTLSKVVHSSSWDGEFKGYIQGFTARRGEFEFALSVYIGHAVNSANDKLVSIEDKYVVVFAFKCVLNIDLPGWTSSCVISMRAHLPKSASLRGKSTYAAGHKQSCRTRISFEKCLSLDRDLPHPVAQLVPRASWTNSKLSKSISKLTSRRRYTKI